MKFSIDHDLHIHSFLSTCAKNPAQTPEGILSDGAAAGLTTLCITDHFWDEAAGAPPSSWYEAQDFAHICKDLPLPKREGIRLLFGCETELDREGRVGISKERTDAFSFLIVPTTHFHMKSNLPEEEKDTVEKRVHAYLHRLDTLLAKDLPWQKTGIAHLACSLICKESRQAYLDTLAALPEEALHTLFAKAARLGVGIELNGSDMAFAPEEESTVLRPFVIARDEGCLFYLGSDTHSPTNYQKYLTVWERAIDALSLTEEQKIPLLKGVAR